MPWIGFLSSAILIAASLVLLAAGLRGKQGVLRIGKEAVPQEPAEKPAEEPATPSGRATVSNVVLGIAGVAVGTIVIVLNCLTPSG